MPVWSYVITYLGYLTPVLELIVLVMAVPALLLLMKALKKYLNS